MVSVQDLKKNLIHLIRQVSYREGDFTLSSGKKSKYYIDLKATTLHPDGAYWIGQLAYAEIWQKSFQKLQAVGGLTLGADPIATAVSLACRGHGLSIPAFIVRKEPKKHGTSQFIEGSENLLPQAQLLIVEDVITTGSSSIQAIEKVRAAGYQPRAVLAVVDRQEGGAEALDKLGVPLISLLQIHDLQKGAS